MQVVQKLQQSKDVNFVSLDADRAYPKKDINRHEIAQAYEIDWEGSEYTRGRSYRTTSTLYDEWIKYLLASENQSGERLLQGKRRAAKLGIEEPEFVDQFDGYSNSLQQVLPHLLFTGVDSRKKALLFDTTGLELNFSQLSGGEREIAFLVGQIDRFRLRQGLFLLDEPELHLNSDLIRSWVGYLTGTVESGQIWLATHSLEAAEAAGQHATFVLERNEETRTVDTLARLDARPVLSALSRAVGTPAFSISQLVFVFVEGEESVGERERFRRLSGLPVNTRFLECGSCNEVLRRVSAIKALANEAEGIRIGGVVDRDFRSDTEAEKLAADDNVFVLPVHEVENLFLDPATLSLLLVQNGRNTVSAPDLIKDAADLRAGSWVFQHAMSTRYARDLPEVPPPAKDCAKRINWSEFEADSAAAIQSILDLTRFDDPNKRKMKRILEVSVQSYASKREADDLWKKCEGKELLSSIASQTGFSGPPALQQAVFAVWGRENFALPQELTQLRQYLASL